MSTVQRPWPLWILLAALTGCPSSTLPDDDDDSSGDDDDDDSFADDDDDDDSFALRPDAWSWGGTFQVSCIGGPCTVDGTVEVVLLEEEVPICTLRYTHAGSVEQAVGLVSGCALCEGLMSHGLHTFDGTEPNGCGAETGPEFLAAVDAGVFDAFFGTRGLISHAVAESAGLRATAGGGDTAVVGNTTWVQLAMQGFRPAWLSLGDLGAMFPGTLPDASDDLSYDSWIYDDGTNDPPRFVGAYGWQAFYRGTFE